MTHNIDGRTSSGEPTNRRPLRLWPGITAAVLLVLVRLGLPVVWPDGAVFGVIGAVVAALLIVVWWLFFSRAPWSERLGALVLMAVALAATRFALHESIRGGMMGLMPLFYGIPVLSVALVAGAVVSRRLAAGSRRTALAAAIVIACALMTTVRTGGVTGDGMSDLHWRWTPTPEERLLARATDESFDSAQGKSIDPARGSAPVASPAAAETPQPAAPAEKAPGPAPRPESTAVATTTEGTAGTGSGGAAWPGFRGPGRDGVVRGAVIETDWAKSPPVELWRKPIGPGWSSFAVAGDLIYTQEQRGEDEVVSSYRLSTGKPVWRHRDGVRFYESNGGPGPRATPTLGNGRVYTLGATGIVNALDAGTGAVVWSRNAVTDTGHTIPDWGLASSPLVVGDLVIVAVAGQLIAYEAATGSQRWVGEPGGGGYSSPHLATIDGVPQVLLLRGARTISVAPADGTLLWEHSWQPAVSILQPAVVAGGSVLIAAGDAMGGLGIRRIAVARGPSGWSAQERWTSRGLKPYYNDFVVHKGHAFGFDGSILSCIDIEDGGRKWKGGRYGNGQLVLLPDQDLLLVVSEHGELALVRAAPDSYTEVAKVPAIEGKTWNHPVVVGDVLLIRNGEEMAAFRLPRAGR